MFNVYDGTLIQMNYLQYYLSLNLFMVAESNNSKK